MAKGDYEMTAVKYARWSIVRVDNTTMKYVLRAGEKGKGRVLGEVKYLFDSYRSLEKADNICDHIAARAQAKNYTILPLTDN